MANCKRCGAYIPDGHTACLACGYNEKAEATPKNTGAAAAQQAKKTENDTTYHFKNNDEIFRQQFEENRRRQQEQSRKWAEQEAQRRRMAEENTAIRTQRTPLRNKAGDMSSEMLWSVLSYASILCLVPYLTGKGGETARFHSKQGIRLLVFSAVADALGKIPVIGWLLLAARIYLMIKGMMNALNGRKEPLPYIGTIGPT